MYNVLKFTKYEEIMSKNQLTVTATQPQRNRVICQFNDNQYCKPFDQLHLDTTGI